MDQEDRSTHGDVTRLLADWSAGDQESLERLIPLVQAELRRRAAAYLRQDRYGHTLQPTALVNEAYLRLVGNEGPAWQSRSHFFAVAAKVMRRILVDHARKRSAAKRGGGAVLIPLDEALDAAHAPTVELLSLDRALEALAKAYPRQAKVVELRYFAGLGVKEAAEVLKVSAATIKLDWSLAKAWLFRRLQPGTDP